MQDLTTRQAEKDFQVFPLTELLKDTEKQVKELTVNQTQKDHQYHKNLKSLNKLLRDTEETTQQRVDTLKTVLTQVSRAKTAAEYATAELRTEFEELQDQLIEKMSEDS